MAGLYQRIEDKWYGFLDYLDKSGIPVYKIVDPLEKAGIPSLPAFIVLVLVLLAGLFVLLFGSALFGESAVTFSIVDFETNAPIEGAAITVSGSEIAIPLTATSDSSGKALLKIPLNKNVDLAVEKNGFEKIEETGITFTESSSDKTVTLSSSPVLLEKTIQLFKAGTQNEVFTEDVEISFSCSNSEFSRTVSNDNGIARVDVPNDCGNLIASAQGIAIEDAIVDFSENVPKIFLQAETVETGTVLVYVRDSGTNPVAGVNVELRNSASDDVAKFELSSGSGTVEFTEVPVGEYYIYISDEVSNFKPFSSKNSESGEKTLEAGKKIEFSATLETGVAGLVKLLVKDSLSKNPVSGANVELRKNADDVNPVLPTKKTGDDGKVEFSVKENIAYSVKIDHADYLIFNPDVKFSISDSYQEIELKPATRQSAQSLGVFAIDSLGKPVEGVKLVLKKISGTTVAANIATGADGKAEFVNLETDETYFVVASKSGFESKTSNAVKIKEREKNELSVTMPIGFGNFEIRVLNEEQQPVNGASVKAIDLFSGEKLSENMTGPDGKALIENIRVDKTIFFLVDALDYPAYHSVYFRAIPDGISKAGFSLAKESPTLKVEFLGLYIGDEAVQDSIASSQKYAASFSIQVPKNNSFNEVGLHIRLGNAFNEKTNIMEEDAAYIKDVFSSGFAVKGTSYTPMKGYGIDSGHLTSSSAKWANVLFREISKENGASGTYNVMAEIQVKDSVKIGDTVSLWYRAWGKGNGYVRNPKDDELGSAELTKDKQALYANANLVQYSVGTSTCTDNFCKSLKIADTAKQVTTAIADRYPAKISSDYKLMFTISSISNQAFANATLEAGSETAGIIIKKYSIYDTGGKQNSGEVNDSSFSQAIGNLGKNLPITGVIEFRTAKDGLNVFNLSIKSAEMEELLNIPIEIDVASASSLSMQVLPKEIIPFIDNQLLIKTTDSNSKPVAAAAINIKLNGVVIAIGNTDVQGIYAYRLNAPNANDVLEISALKTGYTEAVKAINISTNILQSTPPKILEKLNVSTQTSIESGLLLSNQTAIPLTIKAFSAGNEFKDYIDVKFKEDYSGKVLDSSSDQNIYFTISLAKKGLLLSKPTTLNGIIAISVSNDDFAKTWTTNIPMEIRIGMGESVDAGDCLVIEPAKWDIIGDNIGQKTLSVALKNNCSVQSIPIDLRNLEFRIDWGTSNKIAEFTVSSEDLKDAANLTLSGNFQTMVPILPKKFNGILNFKFNPDTKIKSGQANPTIILKAANNTQNGEETVEAKLKTTVKINKLSSCISIKAQKDIILTTSPYGTGYGLFQSYGYDPYAQNGYAGYNQYTPMPAIPSYGPTPYTSNPSSGYANYPASSITAPYNSYPSAAYNGAMYTGYSGLGTPQSTAPTGIANSFGASDGAFKIENNCTDAVEISIDSSPAIIPDKTKFTIEPNNAQSVALSAGYRMGKYSLEVMAKIAASNDKPTSVGTVTAVVRRLDEVSRDCIKISPYPKMDFSAGLGGFIGKPIQGKIYNYCYDSGVRLDLSDQAITFTCFVPQTAQATATAQTIQPAQTATAQNQYPSTQWNNQPYPNPYPDSRGVAQNTCDLVSQVFITGYTVDDYGSGSVQNASFEIKPDVSYRQQAILQMKGQAFAQLGGLRVFAQTGYYRIEVRGNARVSYKDQLNQSQSRNFFIIFEDKFGAGEMLDVLKEPGNPNLTKFQDCIDKTALDIKGYWQDIVPPLKGLVLQSEIKNSQYVFDPPTKQNGIIQGIMIIDPQHCGGMDRLSNVPSTLTDKKTGLNLNFALTRENHSIKVIADTSKMTAYCAKIGKGGENGYPISAKLTRVFPAETQSVSIPLTIWIARPDIDLSGLLSGTEQTIDGKTGEEELAVQKTMAGDGMKQYSIATGNGTAILLQEAVNEEQLTLDALQLGFTSMQDFIERCDVPEQAIPISAKEDICKSDSTGTAGFEKYGFNRLLFDWKYDSIKETSCTENANQWQKYIKEIDSPNNFCDAAQSGIALKKRNDKIVSFVNENKLKFKTLDGVATDSKNLYRFVLKTIKLNDNDSKTISFYANADGSIVKGKFAESELEGLVEKLNILKNEESDAGLIISTTEELLQELSANSENSRRIVGELKSSLLADSTKKILKDIGADDLAAYHFLTFNEYKAFHNKLATALSKGLPECDKILGTSGINNSTKCDIAYGSKTVSITAEILKNILNSIEFKAGVIVPEAKKELSEEDLLSIIEKGGCVEGIACSKFRELFFKDIYNYTFLIKDKYSKNLQVDFKEEYGNNAGNFDAWNFTVNGSSDDKTVEAGKYKTIANYNWETIKTTIEFAKSKNLQDIDKENSPSTSYSKNVFFKLAIDGSLGKNGGRNDYGLTVNSNASNIIFNNYGAKDGIVTAVTGSGIASLKGEYGKEYAGTKDATILSITKTGINYTPSTAVLLKLVLSAGKTIEEGLLYELLDAQGKSVTGTKDLISWSDGETASKDKLLTIAETNRLCREIKTPQYGFIMQLDNEKTFDKTSMFLPYGSPFMLRILCARMSAELSSKQYIEESDWENNESTGTMQGFKNVNEASLLKLNSTENNTANYSIKEYVDFIKAGKACVNGGTDTMTMAWNKNSLNWENESGINAEGTAGKK